MDAFGLPYIELPLTLQQDLMLLMKMERWHTEDLKAPPVPDKAPATFNPFA